MDPVSYTHLDVYKRQGGICAVMGNKPVAKVIGFVFAAVGLVSLIYLQFTQNAFNIADCIAMVLGVMLFTSAKE